MQTLENMVQRLKNCQVYRIGVRFQRTGEKRNLLTGKGVTCSGYEKNNFPECVLSLNIIFELFPFVDITLTSYYISQSFNFIFLNLIANT